MEVIKLTLIATISAALVSSCVSCNSDGEDPSSPATEPETTTSATDSTAYKPTPASATPTAYDGYKLMWHDEFDTDGRPSSDWTPEIGFQRNEELQWYQADNATVNGGCMVIEGRSERVANPNYEAGSADWRTNRQYAEFTSSCMTTSQSYTFKYGRLEVRAKIPVTTGAWPAIWTLGNQADWPMNGEIDVMEFYIKNGAPSILANACWSSPRKWEAVWNESVTPFTHFTALDPDWASKFHLWRMDWDEAYISLYLDGELLNQIDLATTQNQGYMGNTDNPFSNNIEGNAQYILLNLAIGSNGGTPDLAHFPLHYYVDFVRVYQK